MCEAAGRRAGDRGDPTHPGFGVQRCPLLVLQETHLQGGKAKTDEKQVPLREKLLCGFPTAKNTRDATTLRLKAFRQERAFSVLSAEAPDTLTAGEGRVLNLRLLGRDIQIQPTDTEDNACALKSCNKRTTINNHAQRSSV